MSYLSYYTRDLFDTLKDKAEKGNAIWTDPANPCIEAAEKLYGGASRQGLKDFIHNEMRLTSENISWEWDILFPFIARNDYVPVLDLVAKLWFERNGMKCLDKVFLKYHSTTVDAMCPVSVSCTLTPRFVYFLRGYFGSNKCRADILDRWSYGSLFFMPDSSYEHQQFSTYYGSKYTRPDDIIAGLMWVFSYVNTKYGEPTMYKDDSYFVASILKKYSNPAVLYSELVADYKLQQTA